MKRHDVSGLCDGVPQSAYLGAECFVLTYHQSGKAKKHLALIIEGYAFLGSGAGHKLRIEKPA